MPGTHADERASLNPATEITEAWLIRKKIKSAADPVVKSQLESIKRLQKKYAIETLPSVSNALLLEIAKDADPKEVAKDKIDYARFFSGDSTLVDHFLCASHFSLSSIGDCVRALKKDWGTQEGRLRLNANIGIALFGTVTMALILFVIMISLKNAPSCKMLFSNMYGAFPLRGLFAILAGYTILACVAFGPWSLLVAFLLVFGRTLENRDRALLTGILLLCFLLPYFLKKVAYKSHYDLSIARIVEHPYEDFEYERNIDRLKRHIATHPKDAIALFTIARLEEKLDDRAAAMDYYLRSAEALPSWHKPWVNMALIHFEAGNLPEVFNALKKAIAINPQSMHAHLNLGRALIVETRLDEAQSAIKKAKEIDPELFEKFDHQAKESSHHQLIEESVSPDEIDRIVFPQHSNLISQSFEALYSYYLLSDLNAFYALLVLCIAYVWFIPRFLPLPPSFSQLMNPEKNLAPGNFDILNPLSAKHALVQFDLFSSLWAKMKNSWITFFIPGGHFYFQDNVLASFVAVLGSCLLLSPVFMGAYFFTPPHAIATPSASPAAYLFILPFSLVYAALAFFALRRQHGA